MKILLFLLLTSIVLFSCSSDDSTRSISQDEIFGKWALTDITFQGTSVNPDDCELMLTYEFLENNTLDINEYDAIGNNPNCVLVSGNETITYTIDGNVLTYINPTGGFNGGEFVQKLNILELNAQSLKLELFYEIDGFEDDGEGTIPEPERFVDIFTKIN